MIRRAKKAQNKGWAADPGDETQAPGFRERITGNDWAWLALLVALVLVAAIAMTIASRSHRGSGYQQPGRQYAGSPRDDAHVAFLADLARMTDRRQMSVRAGFLSSRTLKLVMPVDVDMDELRFVSRAAATALQHKLRVQAVVWTYTEDNKSPIPKFVAETKWDAKTGDFVVEMKK